MGKRQCIEMLIDSEYNGVFAMSLVDKPAIEEDFVKLSEQRIELKIVDEEKRIVIGFALVPDKKIVRRTDKGTEYDIMFSKQTVVQAAELFMKNLKGNEFTLNHDEKTNGVSVIESWIVEDAKNDKSNIYKLGAKGGEWCLISKIYDDKVWEDVKLDKYNGYSLEGKFKGSEDILEKTKDTEEMKAIKELFAKI
jgi:hypothetical protein